MDSELPPEHDSQTPPPMPPAEPYPLMRPAQPLMQPALPSPATRPGGRRALPLVALGVLLGSIVGGAAGATLVAQRQGSARSGAAFISAPNPSGSTLPAATAASAAAIYQQDAAGVVTITTELAAGFRSIGEATGSGIVVNAQGDILTNQHVVEGARQIRVAFKNGTTVSGTVAGVDASDDLAVVHVSVAADQLYPLALANSDAIQIGDPVLAIGTPFGLSGSLTSGIVSGLGRSGTAPSGRALTGLIQTDAAINPGNSGGPLLNAKGEVIGIDESIQSPVQGSVGVGLAVPVNTAKRVLPTLEKGQTVQHPWLGISGQTITPALADSLGLARQSGVLVVQVVAGSPAQSAGMHGSGQPDSGDDIITGIDGHTLNSIDDLTNFLDTKHVGDHVTMAVVRGGKSISVGVTLADFKQQTTGG
jgi:S1-C subfamily serine protease